MARFCIMFSPFSLALYFITFAPDISGTAMLPRWRYCCRQMLMPLMLDDGRRHARLR